MAQPGSRYSPVRPLTPDERALLFYYCLNHTVTRCLICARSYFLSELVADLLSGRTHLCPQCRRDLTENVRTHVYACGIMPDEVRQKAQALREMAQHLVKESRQLRDKADVLIREAEGAGEETRCGGGRASSARPRNGSSSRATSSPTARTC